MQKKKRDYKGEESLQNIQIHHTSKMVCKYSFQ